MRVIPELRAAHAARTESWGRGEIVLYRKRKWDLAHGEAIPDNCHRLNAASVRAASRLGDLVVELPEPLWVREVPWTVMTALLFSVISRGHVRFVTYAIENNDLHALLGGGARGKFLRWVIGSSFAKILTRICFGSEDARRSYAGLPHIGAVPNALFLELPAPVQPASPEEPRSGALFVGRLEDRKGLRELMEAWPRVEAVYPSDILVVGDGPLVADVKEWVALKPESRAHVSHIEHGALTHTYRSRRVLIAPSKREGRWKEQIGLPIKEALAHGMTVVTTADSGLSPWLDAHGHRVTPLSRLTDAITDALDAPLAPRAVLATLPTVDGREAADAWLKEARS